MRATRQASLKYRCCLVRTSRLKGVSARRLVPVPRQSFPFGMPAYLAIIGRRRGFIRAVARGGLTRG